MPKKGLLIHLVIICIFLISTGCKQYKVFEFGEKFATNNKSKELMTYENDTFKIQYDLWSENGNLQITILNKLSIPVYIDWKKSILSLNGNSSSYWNENQTYVSNTNAASAKVSNNTAITLANTTGTIYKQERISFIASNSIVNKNGILIGQQEIPLGNYYDTSSNGVKFIGFRAVFNSMNSPLILRNQIAWSLQENFSSESYINNTFFLKRAYVTELGVITSFVRKNRYYYKIDRLQ